MKKIVSLLIACVLTVVCAVGFVGCGKDGTNGKVVNLPEREQIAAPVEEHYIVEFYSR